MKRANEKESVDFVDIHGDPFDTIDFPEPDDFEERLAVETVETRGNTKITLGFYMVSTANMQRIKLSIGFNWLTQQQIYLCIQRMPFKYGTDLYLMGYATLINPAVANPSDVEKDIHTKWYSPVDRLAADEHELKDDDKEFLANLDRLQEAHVIVNDVLLEIPISVERTVIKVECPGKKSFEVPIFQVYVPRRFRDAATYLNDCSIIDTQTLKNLVPFAISKNDPASFYPRMIAHAKFLHDNRSITIKSVPPSDYATMKSIKPINKTSPHPVTLKTALRTNTEMIDAIYENSNNRSITISTTATTQMPSLLPWITSILPLFPYRPLCTVNDDRNSKSPTNDTTTRSSKYAKIFTPTAETDDSTVEDSFDPSTISVRRIPKANAWANGPPLNVTFDRESRSVTLQQDTPSHTTNNNSREKQARGL
jgi:hypothetical protein